MMSRAIPQRRGSPAGLFREQIEKAEAAGAARKKMRLHLTHADASLLKRDREVALADISFAEGVMRYLGVQVQEGGVTVSELVTPD